MICAAEDVGCADPMAIVVAASAAQAVERIGMPESQLILAEAAIYVATAPKSNSATEAIFKAEKAAAETKSTIPPYLQDAHYGGSSKLNRGIGYEYAHDFPKHFSGKSPHIFFWAITFSSFSVFLPEIHALL